MNAIGEGEDKAAPATLEIINIPLIIEEEDETTPRYAEADR
ncbi:MAG TPA: hypothetical protein VG826_03440 [Pirellulales bacterium]|nr:hypothetical protein [Pirellulales bacterium]